MDKNDWQVAAVVAMDETKAAALNEPVTLADRFDEIREVFRTEKAHLRVPRRRNRRNDFVTG